MTHQTEAQRLAALLRSRNNNQAGFGLGPVCDEAAVELLRLNSVHADLERVSMQLVACGVVAMADTPDSAKKARAMHPDYESASCDDVKRRVDECIELRARVAELEEILATLPISSLTRLRTRIKQLEEMLAAVGAGGVGPLVSTAVQHQHDFGGKNDLQRKADDSVTSCSTTAADWKLVPVEPTDDMLYDIQEFSHILPPRGKRIWAHMLAAAPQPPTVKESSAVQQPRGEQEPFTVLVRKRSWLANQWEAAPRGFPDYGRSWADERVNVYTHPQPPRQPLTDEQIDALAVDDDLLPLSHLEFARAIERAHGIGGEA